MFTLAIIGRPNVGKSTLFNRLAGKQLALVDDRPGVTRDWREAEGWLYDQKIRIIDTAGLEDSFDDSIEGRMRRQTEAALKQADAVLFLIDGRSGITPLDEHFARWLRKQKLPVVLGVNKCENERATEATIGEAYALGLGEPLSLSAAHGHGMDTLYHAVKEYFPAEEDESEEDSEREDKDEYEIFDEIEGNDEYEFKDTYDQQKPIKIAIVGRPNVGKSTLLNALVEEERVMTGPEAGITRDAIAVDWEFEGRKFKLVDTAGLRKKAKIHDRIEKMSADDSLRAIRLAQIVVLVLDGNAALEKQDLQIADHVLNEGRALIIAVNKWDTISEKTELIDELKYKLAKSLSQVQDVPFVTISALRNKNIDKLMRAALDHYEVWNRRVSTGKLNRWVRAIESQHPAPLIGGRPNRLKYMAQIKNRPPTFILWVSQPGEMPGSYKRYIINRLREDFGFPGVPVRLLVRTSKNPYTE